MAGMITQLMEDIMISLINGRYDQFNEWKV